MSYTEYHSATLRYSGSVSYPASQNGGSVSYSGSIPVNIAIVVKTDEFDRSVSNCNASINGLTAAVVATEVAQIEAKKESSNRIANTIIKGFFDYVGADLAQKISELASKCEATLLELMDQKKTCLEKTTQMQNDYQMISKRYAKIFEDLDRETISRIEQLDRQAFQFVESAQSLTDRGSDSDLLGLATVSANENLQLETVLSCSHVKMQARKLIDSANDYLKGTYRLTNVISNMLCDESESHEIHLPVIYLESVNSDNHNVSSIYGADSSFAPSGDAVASNLRARFMSADISWEDMPAEYREHTLPYFNSFLQADQLDERLQNTIRELMERDNIQTIK